MKIIAEGSRPIQYFINDEGYFNSFDCLVVVLSWVLLGQGGGSQGAAVSVLRLVRLLRLLTLIQVHYDYLDC